MPTRRWTFIALSALMLGLLAEPAVSRAGTTTTFSGQATVVTGTVAGLPVTLGDKGPVAPEGGALEASLLCYPGPNPTCAISAPDVTSGAIQATGLHAAVVAGGDTSHADA